MAINVVKITVLFIIVYLLNYSDCQFDYHNTPPVVFIDRNWRILENEKIGSVVTRVRADDGENDQLEFGLEPLTSTYGKYSTDDDRLPFRIDKDTGVVYLNESLLGRGGENFFIYVTVSDGTLTAKNEVYVNVISQNSSKVQNIYGSRPPTFTPTAGDIRQLLPQLHQLPGMNKNRRPNPITNVRHPPTTANENTNPSVDSTNDDSHHHRQINTYVETNDTDTTNETPVNSSKTPIKLVPINSSTDIPQMAPSLDPKSNGSEIPPTLVTKIDDKLLTSTQIVPIAVIISGIVIIGSAIALFVFRKHLCAISKFLKKKSKEEISKKSTNLNTISGNLSSATEDSQNSFVMQTWLGPMAYNNRYVPAWERDNPHLQATSQLSNDSDINSQSQLNTYAWEFPRHRLKFFNILGEGAFGQVWRCEANRIDGHDGVQTVAVKTLKENSSEAEKNDLLSELQVMKRLEPHVNVVRLLGCCTEKEPIFVILEYVNKGKLQSYLRNSRAERHYGNTHGKSKTLTSGDLTSFMYQVARGMDFLTSRGIIHRDLAARNVLITDEHTCKVADFGFARDIVTSKVYERKSEGRLPIRWMAIESLYDNLFSVKSDIWSFGILMWEIVTLGSTPYPGMAAAEVMKNIREGFRLDKPEHCRRELYNIMYYCWSELADDRPDFPEVVRLLEKLLATETDYIELERFPDHNYYNMNSMSGEKL